MIKINLKNRYFITLAVIVFFSVSLNIFQAVNAATSAPGSTGDPIVSKSYVDSSLKSKISAIKSTFISVNIDAGKKIIAGNSTEIILLSGKATAIKGTSGGLSDVTVGKELSTGLTITANHLLIATGNDGRGLNCITKCHLIIRGSYKV